MLLEVGSKRFSNFDCKLEDVSYNPVFDITRRVALIVETWQISGRLIYGYSVATGTDPQVQMTAGIVSARTALESQFRPRVVLYNDNTVTESAFKMDPSSFLEGPEISVQSWPSNDAAVYSASAPFRLTITGTRQGQLDATGIMEFLETLKPGTGGTIYGHVGGSIGFAEKQIFMQNEPYSYTQEGSAVGLYGYPIPPGPIYPSSRTRPRRITKVSPRKIFPIPMEFEIQWVDEFESAFQLPDADPHYFF